MSEETEEEILAEIADIRAALKSIRHGPIQQSIDGNYLSYAGKATDLRKELKYWEDRLKALRRKARNLHPLQGPDFEV